MSTSLRLLDADTIRRLAPVPDLIDWMREAMMLVSGGSVELPLRRGMALPGGMGAIGMMPGYVGGTVQSAGIKLVSLVPPDRRKGSSHLGLMVLYDADGLVPQAILCGSTVTAIRTAAATALATDTLARNDASSLLILGTGEQAEAHLEALREVRRFTDIRIWARDPDSPRASALANMFSARLFGSIEQAIKGADVICTVTSAREPILPGALLEPGMHVNLVGSSAADAREADDEVVQRSTFFVDYLPSALDQAGELLHAISQGVVAESHVSAEIGDVLNGTKLGRRSNSEVTVYKSLGVAAQDIVTARRVLARAEHEGSGVVGLI